MKSPEKFKQFNKKIEEPSIEMSEKQDVDFGILEKDKVEENREKLKNLISKLKH